MDETPLLVGTYVFDSAQNIDDYLKGLGVGLVLRKVQCVARPTYSINYNPDTHQWSMSSESPFKRKRIVFKISDKIEDETFDCRKCQTSVEVLYGGKVMVLTQECEEGPDVETRVTADETALVLEMKCGEFSCSVRALRDDNSVQQPDQRDDDDNEDA